MLGRAGNEEPVMARRLQRANNAAGGYRCRAWTRQDPGSRRHDGAAEPRRGGGRAWRCFERAGSLQCRVSPAAPVLFFGDLGAYSMSPLRMVTVGLNPSRQEFPPQDPFRRFRLPQMRPVGVRGGISMRCQPTSVPIPTLNGSRIGSRC